MIKTASRTPFFMAKLHKLESNGYVNHTVVKTEKRRIETVFLLSQGRKWHHLCVVGQMRLPWGITNLERPKHSLKPLRRSTIEAAKRANKNGKQCGKNQSSSYFDLPMGTLEPVLKWHSCRLRVRRGRCPNISGSGLACLAAAAGLGAWFESPMSISRMNHLSGFVSTIGEEGVDWMTVNRSTREPNP